MKYILFLIVLILSYSIIKLISTNSDLKESIPYLIKGENFSYFALIDKDGNEFDKKVLNQDLPSLIFVFKLPCSSCNGNILFWNRIAKILRNEVKIYGIIPGSHLLMFDLLKKARLSFNVFVPNNVEKFKKENKIKTNRSYTFFLNKNKVVLNIVGDLTGDDYLKFIRVTKSI